MGGRSTRVTAIYSTQVLTELNLLFLSTSEYYYQANNTDLAADDIICAYIPPKNHEVPLNVDFALKADDGS
jgi:hypothetical protein